MKGGSNYSVAFYKSKFLTYSISTQKKLEKHFLNISNDAINSKIFYV